MNKLLFFLVVLCALICVAVAKIGLPSKGRLREAGPIGAEANKPPKTLKEYKKEMEDEIKGRFREGLRTSPAAQKLNELKQRKHGEPHKVKDAFKDFDQSTFIKDLEERIRKEKIESLKGEL